MLANSEPACMGHHPGCKLWQLAGSARGEECWGGWALLRASFSLNYSSPELAAELLQGPNLLRLEGRGRETSRGREGERERALNTLLHSGQRCWGSPSAGSGM